MDMEAKQSKDAAGFTAGPWEVRTTEKGERCIVPQETASTLFGLAWTLPPDEITSAETIEANAHLIAAAPALFQAIDELLAEIDAGHVGRLTKREGMKAHEESFGTSLARAALALARAPSARGEA
jgi:hypothetical protein